MSSSITVTPTLPLTLPATNPISITASDISFYRENGYLIVPDLLSPSQLEQWQTIIFNAVQDRADEKHRLPTPPGTEPTDADSEKSNNVLRAHYNGGHHYPINRLLDASRLEKIKKYQFYEIFHVRIRLSTCAAVEIYCIQTNTMRSID